MNRITLQTQDGRCIAFDDDGSDAQRLASFIGTHYPNAQTILKNGERMDSSSMVGNTAEEPLVMPTLSFHKQDAKGDPSEPLLRPAFVSAAVTEPPMLMPTINFDQPGANAGSDSAETEPPMLMPRSS